MIEYSVLGFSSRSSAKTVPIFVPSSSFYESKINDHFFGNIILVCGCIIQFCTTLYPSFYLYGVCLMISKMAQEKWRIRQSLIQNKRSQNSFLQNFYPGRNFFSYDTRQVFLESKPLHQRYICSMLQVYSGIRVAKLLPFLWMCFTYFHLLFLVMPCSMLYGYILFVKL